MPPDRPGGETPDPADRVGERIRRFREDRRLSLSQLAANAGVSKGYLSSLENDPRARRPSAETLYAVATALGVTLADLMGRRVLATPAAGIPDSLREFAAEQRLPESDLQMLASIQFRGEQPRSKERWQYIYNAIRTSQPLDEPSTRGEPAPEATEPPGRPGRPRRSRAHDRSQG
jgi:transcriptional regulator with XRE-family HTH domain